VRLACQAKVKGSAQVNFQPRRARHHILEEAWNVRSLQPALKSAFCFRRARLEKKGL